MVFTIDNIPDGIAYPADNPLFRDFIINDYLSDKPFLKARIDAVIAQRGGATTNPSQDIVSWVYEEETFYGFQKIENNDGAIQEAKDNLATLVAGYEAEIAAPVIAPPADTSKKILTEQDLTEQDYRALESLFAGLDLPEIELNMGKVGERLYTANDAFFFNYEMSFINTEQLKEILEGILLGRKASLWSTTGPAIMVIHSLTQEGINRINNLNDEQKQQIAGAIKALNAEYDQVKNLGNYKFSGGDDDISYPVNQITGKTPDKIYYRREGKYQEVPYSLLPSYVKKAIGLTNTEKLMDRSDRLTGRDALDPWVIGQDGKAGEVEAEAKQPPPPPPPPLADPAPTEKSFQELADAFVANANQDTYNEVKEAGRQMEVVHTTKVGDKNYTIYIGDKGGQNKDAIKDLILKVGVSKFAGHLVKLDTSHSFHSITSLMPELSLNSMALTPIECLTVLLFACLNW
jgi:hypothetical protein